MANGVRYSAHLRIAGISSSLGLWHVANHCGSRFSSLRLASKETEAFCKLCCQATTFSALVAWSSMTEPVHRTEAYERRSNCGWQASRGSLHRCVYEDAAPWELRNGNRMVVYTMYTSSRTYRQRHRLITLRCLPTLSSSPVPVTATQGVFAPQERYRTCATFVLSRDIMGSSCHVPLTHPPLADEGVAKIAHTNRK